ncbi:MAG TPA: LysM peptidoglycan-binding domain-containing protein [Acidimicrobiia bacterium]|nr:LysM peptidoglycan-binding domain-containing protein [Acidimicrobiia bacterium]
MEAPLLLVWSVVVALGLCLVADVALADRGTAHNRLLVSSRLRRIVVAAGVFIALTLSTLRPSAAATPPPSVRITSVAAAPASVPADTVDDAAPGPATSTYVVERGDSLWRIAKALLLRSGSDSSGTAVASFWRSIYDHNRETIGDDPNLIHPGQVFEIPGGHGGA